MAETHALASRPSPPTPPAQSESVQPHACRRCQDRKVKCDRLVPKCSKCANGLVECEYRVPAPPRRGKRKLDEADLQARIRHMEGIMRQNGLEIPARSTSDRPDMLQPSSSVSTNHARNALSISSTVTSDTRPRHSNSPRHYRNMSNNSRWDQPRNPFWQDEPRSAGRGRGSSEEDDERPSGYRYPGEASTDAVPRDESPSELPLTGGSDDVLMGIPTGATDQSLVFPSPETCSRLWIAYQENFNPLSRVIHVPSVEPLIVEAMAINQRFTPGERALVFAIFAAAALTLHAHDCQRLLGQPRDVLLQRYRLATKQALVKARFLHNVNLAILQAFNIHLISNHQSHSAEAAWTLSGVAVRMGICLGVQQKDLGELRPLDAEVRLRLWWAICIYDTQLSEVAGQRSLRPDYFGDTDMPRNLDDADLTLDLLAPPHEREGPTESMFVRIRYEFGLFLRRGGLQKLFTETCVDAGDTGAAAMLEKDRTIDELERVFESRYLRYCDPLVPLQFLSTILARCIIARLRLMAHHPRQYADRGASLPASETDMLFALSLKALEYDAIVQSTPSLRGFRWHTQAQIQWLALVYVLSDLRRRASGLESDKAWRQIESIYATHAHMLELRERPIFRALAALVDTAWEAREARHLRLYGTVLAPLPFVAELRARRRPTRSDAPMKDDASTIEDPPTASVPMSATQGDVPHAFSASAHPIPERPDPDASPQDLSPVDWAEWDELVRDFEIHTQAGTIA